MNRKATKAFLRNPIWPLFIPISMATVKDMFTNTVFFLSGTINIKINAH